MVFRRFMAAITAAGFLLLGFQGASAGVIGTRDALADADRAAHVSAIQAALAREDVRAELVSLGVDPVAAGERVRGLSDAELAQAAGQLAELPAGGDSLLAVVGIVFIVLLILELTGVIDIFKKM